MSVPAIRIAVLLAAMIAAWQPPKAHASQQDTQFWLFGTMRTQIADNAFVTIDASQRWREDRIGAEQQHLRAALDRRVARNLAIGGGAAYFTAADKQEFRPHQQLRLFGNGFEARTRFEQRFFDDAEQVELRLRQRVQYGFALTGSVNALVAGEWLKLLQARDRQRPIGTQELRALAGVIVPISDRAEITPAYLMILTPRPDRPDKISHVPQVTIAYRF